MRSVSLAETAISDAGLAQLQALEEAEALTELDLSGTAITDAGLVHLKPFEASARNRRVLSSN